MDFNILNFNFYTNFASEVNEYTRLPLFRIIIINLLNFSFYEKDYSYHGRYLRFCS